MTRRINSKILAIKMSRSTLHIVNNHEEMVLWVIYTDADMKEKSYLSARA